MTEFSIKASTLEELLQASAELLKHDGATILKNIPEVPEEILTSEQIPVQDVPMAEPEPVKEEAPAYTDIEMRKMLADLNKKYPDDKPASGLIKKIGFDKFSEVPKEKYAELAELVNAYAAG